MRLRHRDDRDLARRAPRALARRVDPRADLAPALGDRRSCRHARPRAARPARRAARSAVEHLDERQPDHVGHRAAHLADERRRDALDRVRAGLAAPLAARDVVRDRQLVDRAITSTSVVTTPSRRPASPTIANAVITWCVAPDSRRSIAAASRASSALPRIAPSIVTVVSAASTHRPGAPRRRAAFAARDPHDVRRRVLAGARRLVDVRRAHLERHADALEQLAPPRRRRRQDQRRAPASLPPTGDACSELDRRGREVQLDRDAVDEPRLAAPVIASVHCIVTVPSASTCP